MLHSDDRSVEVCSNVLVADNEQPPHDPNNHPNPASAGYIYNFSQEGGPVRESWHIPKTASAHLAGHETSPCGCRKRRYVYVGHRQRCGIWVWTCMRCETIVAFHVMPKGEGTRDAICPLLKFKTNPPDAVFFDWACKANESSLNWAGGYFRDTSFYHDVFHGVAHKCPPCYDSRRIPRFAGLNTSLMEQVNSYLQPLRGILKSGTTRVSFLLGFHFETLLIHALISPVITLSPNPYH